MTDIEPTQETLLRRELAELNEEAIKLFRYGYEVSVKVPMNNEASALYTRQQSDAFNDALQLGRDADTLMKKIARIGIEGVI